MTTAAPPNHGTARRRRLPLLSLTIVFVLIVVLSSTGITLTVDESLHYHYGPFVLQGNSDRSDDTSMAVSAVRAFPLHMTSRLPDGARSTFQEGFFPANALHMMRQPAEVFCPRGLQNAFEWIAANTEPNDLVLAAARTGKLVAQ